MAKEFESDVQWFVKAVIKQDVFFPEGKVKCQYCPFCRSESDLKRFWCRLNNQMIYNPFVEELPEECPLELTGEIIGERKE